MSTTSQLAGRSVLVTGASRGIGRALAEGLAARGARLCLSARSPEPLEEAAEDIRSAGGEAVVCAGDVTDADDVESMVQTCVEAYGSLDVMINNAGILRGGSVLEQSIEDFDAVLHTNVRGMFLGTRTAARHMVQAGGGKIINVASVFGMAPVRGYATYCASKAAILQYTRVAAVELAKSGIQVNAIAPGYVATDLNTEALQDEKLRSSVLRRIPAGRISNPEDLVPLTAFLATSDSDYVTGETIVIDGGFALS